MQTAARMGGCPSTLDAHSSRAAASQPPAPPRAGAPSQRAPQTARRALSGLSAPDAPPFTKLSTPVYSLSSAAADGSSHTLNVITYASPIALRPVRKYALGLYIETLTYANVKATGRCVLQILQQRHSEVVPLLGKRSGRSIDKLQELRARGFEVGEAFGLPVLADHAGAVELKVVSDFIPCGDHQVVICEVVDWRDGEAGFEPLYTDYLKQAGIL